MRGTFTLILAGLTVTGILLSPSVSQAQVAGGEFEIRRSTVDNGVQTLSGSGFEIIGTVGQPDPGVSDGGTFELVGGFWLPDSSDLLFKDSYEE